MELCIFFLLLLLLLPNDENRECSAGRMTRPCVTLEGRSQQTPGEREGTQQVLSFCLGQSGTRRWQQHDDLDAPTDGPAALVNSGQSMEQLIARPQQRKQKIKIHRLHLHASHVDDKTSEHQNN